MTLVTHYNFLHVLNLVISRRIWGGGGEAVGSRPRSLKVGFYKYSCCTHRMLVDQCRKWNESAGIISSSSTSVVSSISTPHCSVGFPSSSNSLRLRGQCRCCGCFPSATAEHARPLPFWLKSLGKSWEPSFLTQMMPSSLGKDTECEITSRHHAHPCRVIFFLYVYALCMHCYRLFVVICKLYLHKVIEVLRF